MGDMVRANGGDGDSYQSCVSFSSFSSRLLQTWCRYKRGVYTGLPRSLLPHKSHCGLVRPSGVVEEMPHSVAPRLSRRYSSV